MFAVVSLVVLVAAFLLSMRIRWIGPRRQVMIRCVGIWVIATMAVVITGDRTLGSVPVPMWLIGPGLVGVCAWAASSAH